jgi:aspartyl-tRNA(Asn)/glutamyl-tRNA(Gln) amidotransferase subunit C
MISLEEILKLASLSRIAVTEEEAGLFAKEIEVILQYVGTINTVEAGKTSPIYRVENVMREDGEPHETGRYTDEILREAPEAKEGYIVVKKILGS